MKERKNKELWKRRAICNVTVLAMVLSSLVIPQGAATVYADEGANADQITVEEDTQSPYIATQIKNGNFEETPWEDFVYGGTLYEGIPNSVDGKTIDYAIPNGVGAGWNTTENKTYKGSLFEVWDVANLPAEKDRTFPETNGQYFIEMNANNPACLYQDLPTQGGDVIKWTLQHAARTGLGFQEQRMYVTVGEPKRNENGEIAAATGVGVIANNTIDNQINTNILEEGKAEYRYDSGSGSFVATGSAAYANTEELEGLSVLRSDSTWHDVAGIYIVPEGQDVTRFAFCADALSRQSADTDVKALSGGNFLDNITFSTLIGSITATKQTDGDVDITGYWGDEDPSKKLIVKIGSDEHEIVMTDVCKKNFVINVPKSIIDAADATDIQVYHEDYRSATTTVTIVHEHSWNYTNGDDGNANKLYANCLSMVDPVCSWSGAENKLTLTLAANDAIYSGDPYTGASVDKEEKIKWEAAGLTVPKIQYEGTGDTAYTLSETAPTDVGRYKATITMGSAKAEAAFCISEKDIASSGVTVTINPSSYEYTGTEKEPEIKVKDGYRLLTPGTDYTVSGATTGAAVRNDYTITITGQGNYEGTVHKTWQITNANIKSITKNEYRGFYDGASHSASVSVNDPSGAAVTYSEQQDGTYIETAPSYTEVGTRTIYYKIEKENYVTSTGALTVTILPKPITAGGITVSVNADSYVYDGAVKTPVITVKDGERTLTCGTEYTLSGNTTGSAISGVVDYRITVEGTGNYIGTVEKTWKIVQAGGGSGSGGGSSSGSGGGGGTPPAPSESTNPVENFSIPVKNENTVNVEAEIKSGTANVSEITTDTIDKIVNNKDAESKIDTITIDLSDAKQEVTGVTLSKTTVETLAKTTAEAGNGIETATIELSKATVVLDHKTLETLVEQAKGNQIELVVADTEQNNLKPAQKTSLSQCQVATTFEAYFTSDGQRIHDFKGGKAVVSIDFTPEAGKDTSYYHLVYVADNGDLTRYKTKYENGKLMFTTTHFSDYAIIYDTSEKNETGEQPGEEEAGDSTGTDTDTDTDTDTGTNTDTNVTLDTTYSKLRLRIPTSTRTTNVLKWTKESGADGYVIYGNKCNSNGKVYKMVKQVTIKDGNTTTWTDKNLASGTYYKYYIKAYKLVNGKKVWIAQSKVVHSTTTGGKYGNAKTVKLNKTSVSLTAGKAFTIKAVQVIKDKPIAKHANIKFESSNSKVASVTGKGVIKAKKKGTCYIYVYAQNGMYKRIKVVVK